MHTTGAVSFGFVCGLLAAAVLVLGTLMRYVSADLEGFRKWLDTEGVL